MVKDTHVDGSLIKEQMMLLGLNLLIKIETTTLLKPDTYICGWTSWLLLLDGWEEEFSAGYLSLVLCNQWFVYCLILIFIRVSLGGFFFMKITALLQSRRIRSREKYLRALLQLCCLLLYSCSLPCQCCCSQVVDLLGLLVAQHSAAPACESGPGSGGGTCQGSRWGPCKKNK